jgi:hypothetical protein
MNAEIDVADDTWRHQLCVICRDGGEYPADVVIIVVDVLPWQPEGNYSHTVVQGNRIIGGYATGVRNVIHGRQTADKELVW